MKNPQQFALPDVGEGLTEAEITNWYVKVGDTVAINDTLVEIETAKSAVELPSPYAGVVSALLAEEGESVDVGTPIIEIGGPTGELDGSMPDNSGAESDVETPTPSPTPVIEDEDKPQVLVGPGPTEAAARRRRLTPSTVAGTAEPEHVVVAGTQSLMRDHGTERTHSVAPTANGNNTARATPPVRLRAKQLGVDIDSIGAHGQLLTRDDVEAAAGLTSAEAADASPAERIPAAGSDARESRVAIRGVRKMTAEAMVRSAFTAPHVTEWLTIDVTPTMDLLAQVKADRAWEGVRVNPLVLVARAFVLAIKTYPEINASWDENAQEIVIKHFINLGIAAATPRGLIVPNIKNAHLLDVRGLAGALTDLISIARSGKTPPADMANGTVTITNIGALGVDAGTPILNPGESAILAFGAIRQQPWVVNGDIKIRYVTQLAMSFDHRLVDGELGSKVLARTGAILSDPGVTLLHV